MLAKRAFFRAWSSAECRLRRVSLGLLLVGVGVAAGGCFGGNPAAGTVSPVVGQAQANVRGATPPLSAFHGPAGGPSAQAPAPVVFVAADLTNGGTAAVARGVQQAAHAIGWPLRIVDGQASVGGQRLALLAALRQRPGGIILGGVNAASQRTALQAARAQGVPVVGWHSAARPGPDPTLGLFTNVTSSPAAVAQLAADYVIADSHGTAGVAIFTDTQYALDAYTAQAMRLAIGQCRRCSVLQVVDFPAAFASVGGGGVAAALLQTFGPRLDYLLATDGAYIDGASAALIGAGRSGSQPPYSVVAGQGDESEFARIRGNEYQKVSIAEPLNLQGWQLIDELNRARARQPPSAYVAPPSLITKSNVPNTPVLDPPSGYRQNYLRIWGR